MRQPAQKSGGPIGTEKLGLLEDGVRGLFLLVGPVSTQPSPFGVVEAGNPVSVHHSCPKRRTDIAPRKLGKGETVASFLEFFRPRTGLMQGLRGLCTIGRLLIPLHVQGDTLANVFSRPR